jgi:PAS domain S-box-containing protein
MSVPLPPPSHGLGAPRSAGAYANLFEAAFEQSPSPVCIVRQVDGAVVAVNEAWLRATGFARADLLHRGISALWGRSPLSVLAGLVALGDDQPVQPRCTDLLAGDGTSRSVWMRVSTLVQGGESLCMLLLESADSMALRSLTHPADAPGDSQPKAQLAMLQQVQLHPAVEKLARVGHWINAESDENVDWSPGLYEIAGLEPRATIPRFDGRGGIHADDLKAWLVAREVLDGREVQYRWTRPNGEMRWLRSRMGRTELAGRGLIDFGVVQDITDEVQAKAALAGQLEFLNNIALHVPGAIYQARRSRDGVATVTYLSEPATDMLELSIDEVDADQSLFFQRVVPEDLPKVLQALEKSAQELSTLKCVFRLDLAQRGRRWIEAEASTQRGENGDVVWHGFLTDVTDRLEASKSLERQHRMLQAVQASQATFIGVEDKRKAFQGLLASFLNVTDSTFGFVAEVLFDGQKQPYLRMQALTNIAWSNETKAAVAASETTGVEFRNLDTLFGHALRTGETVISNHPAQDPRRGGLPPGHPPLESFMGVPIKWGGRLVAMVGLANRPDGFDATDVEFLKPLLGTVRELVMASRAHAERQQARLQFQATSALLANKSAALQATFDSISQGLAMVDAEGRLRFYNQRMLELLDIPEDVVRDQPPIVDLFKFQEERGDFGTELKLLSPEMISYVRKRVWPPPEKYVRLTKTGKMLEVVTRVLPAGGFVRTYTDVTSYFDTQEALREERQRLQWVLEATRPGIWEVNVETKEAHFNERWASMLGYTVRELTPSSVATWESLIHPNDRERARRKLTQHLVGDLPYYECDLRMRHKGGHWLWVNDRGRVHRRDEAGNALYMSGTLLDIHDRVAAQEEVRSLNNSLERRVAERTAELERSMKDMEAISYSIAHDLRAPLRSVNGFASVIAADEGERLSPEALRMFERIARSSRNMGQMITDMLELLRVVRVDLVTVPVNMSVLAHSVSESLAPGTPNALIGIKQLPPVMGDATLLRQVLMNLMDNALKYARHRPQPEVVLGFDERQRAFYMRDNGMGFDMARAGKLFGLFQRMHADSEVPGTGVGLAIVARIVERHGGRIWAEAEPGKGATFWWTLPKVSMA